MARKPSVQAAEVTAAEQVVKYTRDARVLRSAMAVLLAGVYGMSLRETGAAIGRSRATVTRILAESRPPVSQPDRPRPNWGGRRRQNLSPEEGQAFLAPSFADAERGGILVVAPIKAAYQKAIGRPVPDSTVYGLLARHGWRRALATLEPDAQRIHRLAAWPWIMEPNFNAN